MKLQTVKKMLHVLIAVWLLCGGAWAAETDSFLRSEPWIFTVSHQTLVGNPAQEPIRDLRLTIPLMDTVQPVYQELLGEEFSLWPERIMRSAAGTRLGVFRIPVLNPGQEIVLTQKFAIRNYLVKFNVDNGISIQQDYSGLDPRYLLPETRIQSQDSRVINYARDVAGGETNPLLVAERLFADINLFMTYTNGLSANQGALSALKTGEGVCEDYTDLFVAAARALGIPARWQTGYLYLTKEYTQAPYILEDGSLDITLMRHTWPEFYLAPFGWVVLDPTHTYYIRSGENREKAVDWTKFAAFDSASRHIFFAGGSHDDEMIQFSHLGPRPAISFSETMVYGNRVFAFRDAVNSWAKDSIRYLTSQSPPIIGGYGNGLFGPDDPITRAQLAAMVNRAVDLDYRAQRVSFPDVPAGYWAYADISATQQAGVIAGYPDGTFRPNQPVTRGELAVILDRAFDLDYPAAGFTFPDLGEPGYAWADASIVTLAGNGIAGGFPDGLFHPERQVTRAEFAAFLTRVLEKSFRLPSTS